MYHRGTRKYGGRNGHGETRDRCRWSFVNVGFSDTNTVWDLYVEETDSTVYCYNKRKSPSFCLYRDIFSVGLFGVSKDKLYPPVIVLGPPRTFR